MTKRTTSFLAGVLVLAACASQTPGPVSDEPNPPTTLQESETSSQEQPPTTHSQFSTTQQQVDTRGVRADLPEIVAEAQRAMILLERAENTLITACMAESGFDYYAPTDADVAPFAGSIGIGRLTPEVADKDGYSLYLPETTDDLDQVSSLMEKGNSYLESLSPSEQERYFAVLEGEGDASAIESESGTEVLLDGCIGEARSELLGDRVLETFDTFNTVQFLQVNVWDDPSVTAALSSWQSCIRESGYRYEHPDGAVAAGLQMRGDNVEPSEEEFDLARSDAECRLESGLISAIEEASIQMNSAALEENEQLLATWAEIERFVLDRAGEILGVTLTDQP